VLSALFALRALEWRLSCRGELGEECMLDAIEPDGELDGRFCEVMDAAPVMIWVSGRDKCCIWFNRPWLTFTGRDMAQEMGNGWAEGVHPEDFNRCLSIYTSRFDARANFRMQYRLRRHDGDYRWIDDIGIPRYARDGTFLGYIGSCIDVTHHKNLEREAQELSERLVNLQEEERQSISQELHDTTAQHLVAASLNLSALRSKFDNNDNDGNLWDEAESCLIKALNEIRTLSYVMHPIGLGVDEFTSTLRRYVEGYSNRSGLRVRLRSTLTANKLPLRMQRSLFRIVQEALTNVHRHASATEAFIKLRRRTDRLHLIIADNGRGMEGPDEGALMRMGVGIYGIKARVRQYGGDLRIRSGPHGTTVHVVVGIRHQYPLYSNIV
jgi:PAS domain S-box-containing protein